MSKGRLEAFSDGVIAIFITIMVLEFKVPHEVSARALLPLVPTFASYVLSFIYLGIYWNNHHHMLQAVSHVDGRVLWANLHLLFWLSLIPFATAWVGEHHVAPFPVAFYGVVLLFSALAFVILTRVLVSLHGQNSKIATAIGTDRKGKISIALYIAGIAFAFVEPWLSVAAYVVVAAIWLVPDSRIERTMKE